MTLAVFTLDDEREAALYGRPHVWAGDSGRIDALQLRCRDG
jgi:hypothetical protein